MQLLQKNKKFKALVTAGPTREYIDPVRFISNKSSGKQGYEIAKSFRDNGFETTLISGQTNLDPISGLNFIKVETAKEMFDQTIKNLPADVAIFTAPYSSISSILYFNPHIIKLVLISISKLRLVLEMKMLVQTEVLENFIN